MNEAKGASSRREYVRDTAFTWPNLITLLRFLGVPLFVWLVFAPRNYPAAVLVLALIGATDWVDGYVARRYDQISRLGKIVDPLADRVLMIVVIIALAAAGIAPWWMTAAILVPDLVLSAISAVLFHGPPDQPTTRTGKWRTALLMVGTPSMLLGSADAFVDGPLWLVGFVLTVLGCAGHCIASAQNGIGMLRAHRENQREAEGE